MATPVPSSPWATGLLLASLLFILACSEPDDDAHQAKAAGRAIVDPPGSSDRRVSQADGAMPSVDLPMRLAETRKQFPAGRVLIIRNRYDTDGNIIVQTFTLDGSLLQVHALEYAEDGQLVQRLEDIDADGIVDRRQRYLYDDGGALKRRLTFVPPGTVPEAQRLYRHDPQGRLAGSELRRLEGIAEPISTTDGEVIERVNFGYRDGRLITARHHLKTPARRLERRYVYADNGLLASEIESDLGADTVATSTFRYERGPCNSAWQDTETRWFCLPAAPSDQAE